MNHVRRAALKTLAAIAFTALFSPKLIAEIYQWKDAAGKTHYGDEIPGNATEVQRRDKSNLPYLHRADPVTPTPTQRKTTSGGTWAETNNSASLSECIHAKRNEIIAEKSRDRKAENLSEWIWENCRDHDAELRKIEQQMM
jgi:hypothetical protein